MMHYRSTRDVNNTFICTSAQAIKQGLAADGGLFVPLELPELTEEFLLSLAKEPYDVRAAKILHLFLDDYSEEELLADCAAAYREQSFPGGAAPLVKVDDFAHIFSLELWHGPTAAFKDMALQIMPRLLSRALKKTGEDRTALILVATSGDTGKAALEGYRDIDQIKIMVYYPVDGVSRVQKLQMATQEGSNVNVCAIRGNFDDAQSGVKKIFNDADASAKLSENGYGYASACLLTEHFAILSAGNVFDIPSDATACYLVNLCEENSVIIKGNGRKYRAVVYDCLGNKLCDTVSEDALCELNAPMGSRIEIFPSAQ
jgi:threonine synthase